MNQYSTEELRSALEAISQSILKQRSSSPSNGNNNVCFKNFSGMCIGAFKRCNKVSQEIINKSFSNEKNFDFDSRNVNKILLSLFIKIKPSDYGKYGYILLSDITKFNPEISECGRYSDEEINVLRELKAKAESEFTDVDVEDPFQENQDHPNANQQPTSSTQTNDSNGPNTVVNQNDTTNTSNNSSIMCDKQFFINMFEQFKLDMDTKVNRLRDEFTGNHNSDLYLTSERVGLFRVKVKQLFNKKLRYENDIKILKIHEELKSVPEQLNFDKFPEPFLKHNLSFIEDYNKLLSNFQSEIMSLIKRSLKSELDILQKDLNYYKSNLRGIVNNVDEFIDNLHKHEEKNLEKQFIDSDNKARRVKLKPFLVSHQNVNSQTRVKKDDNNFKTNANFVKTNSRSSRTFYNKKFNNNKTGHVVSNNRSRSNTRSFSKQSRSNSLNNSKKATENINDSNVAPIIHNSNNNSVNHNRLYTNNTNKSVNFRVDRSKTRWK